MIYTSDMIVIGAGAAGLAAAIELARSGRKVVVFDQGASNGGALYRQNNRTGARKLGARDLVRAWAAIESALKELGTQVEVRHNHTFIGLDADGVAGVCDQETSKVSYLRPRGVVFATGAHEYVKPVRGWHLPGVTTVGGLQVSLKSSGVAPDARVLIAGNGPLILALAAQLADQGCNPVGVIEAGNPLRHAFSSLFRLPLAYTREAMGYYLALQRHGVRWSRGAFIEDISERGDGLDVRVFEKGKARTIRADIVALHDGLVSNDRGLPRENLKQSEGPIVVHAGDCNELLGGRAAPASGRNAARKLLAAMAGAEHDMSPELVRHERAQKAVKQAFEPVAHQPLSELSDETIICRCEQRRVADLKALADTGQCSLREVKLVGRFGLGRCQGRFCLRTVSDLLVDWGEDGIAPDAGAVQRWPVRPISIAALAGAEEAAQTPVHAQPAEDNGSAT